MELSVLFCYDSEAKSCGLIAECGVSGGRVWDVDGAGSACLLGDKGGAAGD